MLESCNFSGQIVHAVQQAQSVQLPHTRLHLQAPDVPACFGPRGFGSKCRAGSSEWPFSKVAGEMGSWRFSVKGVRWF